MKTARNAAILLIALFFVTAGIVAAQNTNSERPYVVGPGITPPKPLYQPLPAYTDEARAARVEGIVLIQAIIRKDGSVDSFKIIRGLGYGLDESAINTIATTWRFEPGTRDGVPVDVMANIEVAFRLFMRPGERESLKDYTLRVQILEPKWIQSSNAVRTGKGRGLILGDNPLGFTYDCTCTEMFGSRMFPARWIVPNASLAIAQGFDEGLQQQKACELQVRMDTEPRK